MRSRRLLLVLLLLVPACGGDEPDPRDSDEPTAQPTAQPTEQQPGEPVGKMLDVIASLARVDGARVGSDTDLFAGNEVTTDVRGRARFSVSDVLQDCQIQTDSRLTVAPSARTPVEVEQGSIICLSKPGEEEFEVPAGEAVVGFLDPIFLVSVDGARTDVSVNFGFVQVRRTASRSESRIVGPGARLTVGSGSLPRAVNFNSNSLDQANGAALRRLRNELPREDPAAFPPTANSRTLNQMKSEGGLRVGIDDDEASGEDRDFAESILTRVAERWQTGVNFSGIDSGEAAEALQRGSLDAFVSPDPVPGAARIVLFGDGGEQPWFLSSRPDGRFESAFERVLKTLLNNGEYGSSYVQEYGRQPTYEAVRSLVYPAGLRSNATQWRQPAAVTPSPTAQPGEVAEVSLTIEPEEYLGECPGELTATSELEIEKPGKVEYRYVTSDDEFIERSRTFEKAGTFALPDEVLEKSDGGWVQLQVPRQDLESPQVFYAVTCD